MTLAELKKKYPLCTAQFEPDPNCKVCDGTGEVMARCGQRVCVCCYVGRAEMAELAQDIFNKIARDFGVSQRWEVES